MATVTALATELIAVEGGCFKLGMVGDAGEDEVTAIAPIHEWVFPDSS